ncbi:MAG: PDZ domain-containing protein [Chthoniobacterales bacterium]|nr:PDZ domain-containing protein [Chthoniobacterales bacterium]
MHSIKVEKVWPASPAAAANLVAGDVVVEIQGLKVDGAKADDLKKVMNKGVGDILRLKVKHDGKELRDGTLKAARKPEP